MARATEHVATEAHEARRERAPDGRVPVATPSPNRSNQTAKRKTAPAEAEAVSCSADAEA
jgi:hypothetical protein